jgi:hypothetical protein
LKRKALALILIATIALSIGTWVIFNRISEIQNLIKNVKIAEFEWERGYYFGGLSFENEVNVTVQNSGANDVSGLTLAVRLIYNGTELGHSTNFTKQIDTLHAGESLKIRGTIYSVLGNRPNGTECVSTLMWGKVILDKQTKVIDWGGIQ